MGLEIQNIRKLEHLSIRNLAQILQIIYETNVAKCNHFHQCLGMVHTTKHFVHSLREITFSLSQTTDISK